VRSPFGTLVRCSDAAFLGADHRIVGGFINKHPLEALSAILQSTLQLPAAMFDYASLDVDDARNSAISHYLFTRADLHLLGNKTGLNHPTSAHQIIKDLMLLVGGGFRPKADGKWELSRYDSARAVDRNLTLDDCTFEVVSTFEELKNEVVFRLMNRRGTWGAEYQVRDDTAAGNYAMNGASDGRYSMEAGSWWLNANGMMWQPTPLPTPQPGHGYLLTDASTHYQVQYGAPTGFCGVAIDHTRGGTTITSGREISASKPAYHMIRATRYNAHARVDDGIGGSAAPEIIKVDEATVVGTDVEGVGVHLRTISAAAGTAARYATLRYAKNLRFKIAGRSQKGTTKPSTGWAMRGPGSHAVSWMGPEVVDVTIPVAIATDMLERHSNGLPRARMRTNLSQYDLQIGDFVTVTEPHYLNYQADGADSTVVWEIVRKETDALGDSPGIDFELVFVRDSVAPAVDEKVEVEHVQPPAVRANRRSYDIVTTAGAQLISSEGQVIKRRGSL